MSDTVPAQLGGLVQAPQHVDLTTLGANTPLPPTDSPFYQGLKQASEIPSLDMTREQMAMRIISLEYLLAKLYRKMEINPDDK